MQRDVNYLLVAVGCLSRYLRVQPMKSKNATSSEEAFKTLIKVKQPKKIWVDQGTNFKVSFKSFCEIKGIEFFTTHSEEKTALAKYQITEKIIYSYLEEH